MIKLDRLKCPPELTVELKNELTQEYKSTKKDVWNNPRIKPFLKKQLSAMSHEKCSYCECKLGEESKDGQIDHIQPKTVHEDDVLEWDNLLLSCFRCNRHKSNSRKDIINPYVHDPRLHLYLDSRYRILWKSGSTLGENSVVALDINHIDRMRSVRYKIGEKTKETIEIVCTKVCERVLKGYSPTVKQLNSFMNLMEEATPKEMYAATVSTVLINDELFQKTVQALKQNNKWHQGLEELYSQVELISLNVTR